MGQENSTPVDDSTPSETLKARTLEAVADYVKAGRAKNIMVMCGAGISTSAGIPDFRSPDTGLYANLARLDLPYAEAVFDISYFRTNPLPFYTLAHELFPGKYRPTISHSFLKLLSDKGLLRKVFTQNVDCLERKAGVPREKLVEAHGSFASQRCIDCKTAYPDELMREAIHNCEVPHCLTPECNGLVKPDIVFFGEPLPEEFHQTRILPSGADLCIVMGTSLSVHPFASLPGYCSPGVPRVLINLEQVGGLGTRADDVLVLEECDEGVRKLASALGWLDELEAYWNETKSADKSDNSTESTKKIEEPKSKDEVLEEKIGFLTSEVEKSLKITADHDVGLRDFLRKEKGSHPSAPSDHAESALTVAKPKEDAPPVQKEEVDHYQK